MFAYMNGNGDKDGLKIVTILESTSSGQKSLVVSMSMPTAVTGMALRLKNTGSGADWFDVHLRFDERDADGQPIYIEGEFRLVLNRSQSTTTRICRFTTATLIPECRTPCSSTGTSRASTAMRQQLANTPSSSEEELQRPVSTRGGPHLLAVRLQREKRSEAERRDNSDSAANPLVCWFAQTIQQHSQFPRLEAPGHTLHHQVGNPASRASKSVPDATTRTPAVQGTLLTRSPTARSMP